jgi:hypothetical protein
MGGKVGADRKPCRLCPYVALHCLEGALKRKEKEKSKRNTRGFSDISLQMALGSIGTTARLTPTGQAHRPQRPAFSLGDYIGTRGQERLIDIPRTTRPSNAWTALIPHRWLAHRHYGICCLLPRPEGQGACRVHAMGKHADVADRPSWPGIIGAISPCRQWTSSQSS